MKLFKSLLLASAAGMVAVSGASAADLGAKKPSPVEYVKACYNPLWGTAGGFVIPGSNTCLRISGRVRADYIYGETFNNLAISAPAVGIVGGVPAVIPGGVVTGARSGNALGFRVRAIINMDAVTQSEIGPVRSFFSLFFQGDRGSLTGGNFNTAAGANSGNNFSVDKAFVQFAGITAGRAQSFFDFAPNFNPGYNFTVANGSDVGSQNLLAYTLPLGATGASLTVSLEDSETRRVSNSAGLVGLPVGAVVSNYAYGGTRMPDVVASLDLNQAWGSFKLSGAVHQVRGTNNFGVGLANSFVSTKYGFAVQAGVKVNLPMIAAGDFMWLQAAYTEGALSYIGGIANVAGISVRHADAFVGNGFGGVKLTKGFSVDAGFSHQWTPTLRQWIVGTYRKVDYANGVSTVAGINGVKLFGATTDTTNWRVGTGIQLTLAPGLVVGAEANYLYTDVKGRVEGRHFVNGVRTSTSGAGAWEGRLRIQRDF